MSWSWVREIFWLTFIFNFHIVAVHIRSEDNLVPDFLSRFADPKRTSTIPPSLVWYLGCFRDGWIEETVAGASRFTDGRHH